MNLSRVIVLSFVLSAAPIGLVSSADAAEPLASVEGKLPEGVKTLVKQVIGEVEDAPRSLAQARRRADQAKKAATSVMRSNGYYGAKVSVVVPRAASQDEAKKASRRPIVTIEPGPQFLFGNINIAYDGNVPDVAAEIKSKLAIKKSDSALAAKVVAVEAEIVNALKQNGYPDAGALKRDAVADHAAQSLTLTYNISAGTKARFGDIILTGDKVVSEKWVKMITPGKAGAIVDSRKLKKLSARVTSTQAFSGASATLSDEAQPNDDGTVTRNIMLNIEEGKKNTISGEVGVSTTDGSGVDIIYTRRNFDKKAQTLKVSGTAKTNLLSFGVDYHIPYIWSVKRSLDLGAEVAREDTDAFTGERVSTTAAVTQRINKRLSLSGGVGLEASRFNNGGEEITALLVEGLGGVNYDTRDSILDSTKGIFLTASAAPTYNFGEDDGLFTILETSGSTYKRISDKLVVAARAKTGVIVGASIDSVPLNKRFFGGGGGSVRGFGFQSISPIDADDELVGGRSLVEASGEIRYRGESPIGFAAFVDAGSVNSQDFPNFDDVLVGAGAGLRYYTSFAPIRADIAVPLNKRDGDDSFQIYISIGQAF